MEEILKSISEKISSYNIFNNLFPGIIFCSVMTKITRFNFATDTIIEQFFMWYFIGMVISRIGSIFVEDTLKKIRLRENRIWFLQITSNILLPRRQIPSLQHYRKRIILIGQQSLFLFAQAHFISMILSSMIGSLRSVPQVTSWLPWSEECF